MKQQVNNNYEQGFLVGKNKGFYVYFDAQSQSYSVYKNGKLVIGNKYKFSDVKSYLD